MTQAELLTTAKAAVIAKVAQSTVNQWCLDGDLHAIRPGYQYLIDPGDLETFLATPRKRPGQYDRATAKRRGE